MMTEDERLEAAKMLNRYADYAQEYGIGTVFRHKRIKEADLARDLAASMINETAELKELIRKLTSETKRLIQSLEPIQEKKDGKLI